MFLFDLVVGKVLSSGFMCLQTARRFLYRISYWPARSVLPISPSSHRRLQTIHEFTTVIELSKSISLCITHWPIWSNRFSKVACVREVSLSHSFHRGHEVSTHLLAPVLSLGKHVVCVIFASTVREALHNQVEFSVRVFIIFNTLSSARHALTS